MSNATPALRRYRHCDSFHSRSKPSFAQKFCT
jgi:hypothetical protein